MRGSTLSTTSLSATGPVTRTLGFLMFLFGWTAVLATALAFLGAVWWPVDVLADWRFILAVFLILAAIVNGFGYSRTSAVVFGIAAIVNIWLIAPMWLDNQPAPTSSDRLRVVVLDVGFAPDIRLEVLEWVNLVEGDIVVLANSGGTWSRVIEQINVPYRIVNDDPGLTGGTLVLARNDLAVSIEERPSGLGTVDVVIEAALGEGKVTILGVSVERPVGAGAAQERIDDFTAINAGVHRMPGPVIIVGNLEASRWSHAFGALADGLTNSENGFGYAATYPSVDWPLVGEYAGIPVDHALYQGPITVTNRRVGPPLGPSHRPIVVDLSPADG
jgi:endonuclease/exonuclease/phosphatase (EEP) superfamily protein YafD